MREISAEEAARLRQSKEAGWYSVEANPPELHDKQHVVEVGSRFFLAAIDEFKIICDGIVQTSAGPKIIHAVEVHNDTLGQLILAETNKYPIVNLDGISARHTQNR